MSTNVSNITLKKKKQKTIYRKKLNAKGFIEEIAVLNIQTQNLCPMKEMKGTRFTPLKHNLMLHV